VITGSIGRRYAKALLEIGVKTQSYDALGKELDRTADAFLGSPELRRTLENPVFPLEKRRTILDELARRLALSKTMRNFLMLLLDKGRLPALPDIARAHRALVDEQAGRVRATLIAARPLEPALVERVRAALEKKTGRVVVLSTKEDQAILGGLITQVGDIVYDGSVRQKLATLREELL